MKIQKLLILAIAVFSATALRAQPTMPPNMSMAASSAALKAYAISHAVRGDASVYSPSQLSESSSLQFVLPQGSTSSVIARVMDGVSSNLWIKMTNTNDYVSVSTDLYDADGDQLFYGGGAAQPINNGSGFTLPKIPVTIYIAYEVPIYVGSGVASAEVVVENSQYGYTETEIPLQVQNGKVYFPSSLAGQGTLVLTDQFGTQTAYNLAGNGGGSQISLSSLSIQTASTFDGIISLTNPTNVVEQVQSYNGVGTDPLFEITITGSQSELAYFNVYTSEGAVPINYWVKLPGWTTYVLVPASALYYGGIYLPAGTSDIIPEWDPNQFRAPDPTTTDGKG